MNPIEAEAALLLIITQKSQNTTRDHLGGGDHAVGVHDPVRVLLSDLGDEEGSHAGASASSQGVGQLESLQTVARLGLLPHNVQNRVNQLGA